MVLGKDLRDVWPPSYPPRSVHLSYSGVTESNLSDKHDLVGSK